MRLATWLCRNLPEPSLTHAGKQAFVARWLAALLRREGFTRARANLQKFLLRKLLEARIRELRRQALGRAFQQVLFGADAPSRVAVTDRCAFEYHAQAYAPSRDYDGRFYPDFLCRLPGTADRPGPVLAVEYKGADRWAGAEDDRLIGGLWANLSEGLCRFVMVKDKRWAWIEEKM